MAGKKGKSKRSAGKRTKRSKRSKRRGSKSSGEFYRVDENGYRCANFAGSVSPFGNGCVWAQRVPGVPRQYRHLVPPAVINPDLGRALSAANPASLYELRNMGVSARDARQIVELSALQGGADQFAQYELGRALQKGRLGALPLYAAQTGNYDPRMAMAMGRGKFNPLLYSMMKEDKFDPMMYAMLRKRK